MADKDETKTSELVEEIKALKTEHLGGGTDRRMRNMAQMIMGHMLVMTVALTAIGGLALASVV